MATATPEQLATIKHAASARLAAFHGMDAVFRQLEEQRYLQEIIQLLLQIKRADGIRLQRDVPAGRDNDLGAHSFKECLKAILFVLGTALPASSPVVEQVWTIDTTSRPPSVPRSQIDLTSPLPIIPSSEEHKSRDAKKSGPLHITVKCSALTGSSGDDHRMQPAHVQTEGSDLHEVTWGIESRFEKSLECGRSMSESVQHRTGSLEQVSGLIADNVRMKVRPQFREAPRTETKPSREQRSHLPQTERKSFCDVPSRYLELSSTRNRSAYHITREDAQEIRCSRKGHQPSTSISILVTPAYPGREKSRRLNALASVSCHDAKYG